MVEQIKRGDIPEEAIGRVQDGRTHWPKIYLTGQPFHPVYPYTRQDIGNSEFVVHAAGSRGVEVLDPPPPKKRTVKSKANEEPDTDEK